MTRNAAPSTPCRSRRAFSLVELLVVISIIALLVGLGAAGFGVFRTEAQRRQTAGLLQNLHSISNEYQAITGNSYDPENDEQCDADGDIDRYIECFVDAARGLDETEQMVRGLRDFLRAWDDGELKHLEDIEDHNVPDTVVDRWGKPVRYFARNVPDDADYQSNMPRHHRPFFASAGPDGQWGDYNALTKRETGDEPLTDEERDLANQAADNLYSFDLD